jgi:hypothetical protein
VVKSGPAISKMAQAIRTGDCEFQAVVAMFGGRQSSNKRGHGSQTSAAGQGREGQWEGLNAPQDVPKAMGAFGELLRQVQGEGLGGPLGTQVGYGLKELADDGYDAVDGERVRIMIVKILDRLRLHCHRRRQRIGSGPPDIPGMVHEVRTDSLDALTHEQAAADVALAVAEAAIKAWSAGKGDAANKSAAATAAAKFAAAGSGTVTPPETPALEGHSKSARRKANAKARKAAGTAAQPPGGQTPAGKAAAGIAAAAAAAMTQAQQQNQAAAAAIAAAAAAGAKANPGKLHSFKPGSIAYYVDKSNKQGAVEAFDYLCSLEYGSVALHERPCAFAAMGTCAKAAVCRKCTTRAVLTSPVPVPAGAVAKVKAACTPGTAAKITSG